MASDHSFDIVSKVDLQELRNAIHMAHKEISTRFDFRGSTASVSFEESPPVLKISADHDVQLKSVIDVVTGKLSKRGVSTQAFKWSGSEKLPSGGVKREAALQQGLSTEKAKEIVKVIKALGLKVQPRIDGESIRVSGKKLDDLQLVIKAVQSKEFGVPVQTENYR